MSSRELEMLSRVQQEYAAFQERIQAANRRLNTELKITNQNGEEVWPISKDWSPIPGSELMGRHRALYLDSDVLLLDFEILAGFQLPVHDHAKDGYEIEALLLRQGEVSYRANFRRIRIRKGELKQVPASLQHSFFAHENSVGKLIFTKPQREKRPWWLGLSVLLFGR